MKTNIKIAAAIAVTLLATTPSAAQQFGVDPAQAAFIENEVDSSMVETLEDFISTLDGPGFPIVIGPYICPRAMEVLARVGSGQLNAERGTKALIMALVEDRAGALNTFLDTGKAPSMKPTSIKLQFEMKNKDMAKTLMLVAREGQAFLKN